MLVDACRSTILATHSCREFEIHGVSNAFSVLNLLQRATKMLARSSFTCKEIFKHRLCLSDTKHQE